MPIRSKTRSVSVWKMTQQRRTGPGECESVSCGRNYQLWTLQHICVSYMITSHTRMRTPVIRFVGDQPHTHTHTHTLTLTLTLTHAHAHAHAHARTRTRTHARTRMPLQQ